MIRVFLAAGLMITLTKCGFCDAFDQYTLPILMKAPEAAGVQELKELTADLIVRNSQVLPNGESALVVVYTNDFRWSKLLVTAARHKIVSMPGADPEFIPILRVDRFVTFREGTERSVFASGQGISLFPGFRFHLDLGQVVPERLGGDLIVSEPKPMQFVVKPVGNAKMYLLTKPMPEAAPQKTQKLQAGEKFEAAYFNGTFKVFDDGRRTGVLRLKVGSDNDVTGTFISDQNGREYEVRGSVSKPNHKIQLVMQLPQTQQEFTGFMFTGDGKAIAGVSKLQERETGFYALRVDD